MELVPSTILAVLAIVALLSLGVQRGLWAFLALAPFGAAAAFNLPALGGASIGVLDLGAVAIFCMVLLTRGTGASLLGTFRPFQPGFFFALVMAIAFLSAMFYPRIFAGQTEVFQIARVEGGSRFDRYPLGPSTGNITQLFRLSLGFLTFAALATSFRRMSDPRPVLRAMAVATGVNFAMGWIDVLTFATGTQSLMEWLRSANYSMHITDTMSGIKRMVGGFPEASSFGFFSLGLFGFWLQFLLSGQNPKLGRWMFALAAISVVRSTSSAAYVALVVFLVAFGLYMFFTNLRPEAGRRGVALTASAAVIGWIVIVTAVASYEMVPAVTDFLDRVAFDKLTTDSGQERMSWNTQAMKNFTDTFGIGAGLGAVRASNWLVACLASLGVPGTMAMLAFMASFALSPSTPAHDPRAPLVKGFKAGALAMLCAAILTHSTPDLGVFFFALMGLSTGLSRAMALDSLGSDAAGSDASAFRA